MPVPDHILLRLRKIYLPYFFVSSGYLATCMLFDWLLLVRFQVIQTDNIVLGFLLPALIAGALVLLVLRKRILLLDASVKTREVLLMFSWVGLVCMTISEQIYQTERAAKITRIDYPEIIFKHPATKYYAIKQAEPLKTYAVFNTEINTVNKNEKIIVCRVVCPLTTSVTTVNVNSLWIAVDFSKDLSREGYSNDADRYRETRDFEDSIKRYYTAYKYPLSFLKREDIRSSPYLYDVENSGISVDESNLVILSVQPGSYSNRTKNTGIITILVYFLGNAAWLGVVLYHRLKQQRAKRSAPKHKQ